MTLIFRLVTGILLRIGRLTGRTYNEINILVYYFLVPFSWFLLLDILFDFHYFKIAFAGYCLVFAVKCKNFRLYSDELFDKSVSFLNYFNKFGSNYVRSSVWICVAIPVLIYVLLLSAIIFN
jgi:hypothetical protein